jgi:hypothetical protein
VRASASLSLSDARCRLKLARLDSTMFKKSTTT